MKTYTILLFCLLIVSSCKKEKCELPPVGGRVYISFQNTSGENLLNNVETDPYGPEIILRQGSYKFSCFVNESINNGLQEGNSKLYIHRDSVTGERNSIRLFYGFTIHEIPDNGTFRFDLTCERIFDDTKPHSIRLKYDSSFRFYAITEFQAEDDNITIKVLNQHQYENDYHILLTIDDRE